MHPVLLAVFARTPPPLSLPALVQVSRRAPVRVLCPALLLAPAALVLARAVFPASLLAALPVLKLALLPARLPVLILASRLALALANRPARLPVLIIAPRLALALAPRPALALAPCLECRHLRPKFCSNHEQTN
jgi:hypothetical protein